MRFDEAARCCHVRGYIARKSKPNKKYAKAHKFTFYERIPFSERMHTIDWIAYDPEGEETSIVG